MKYNYIYSYLHYQKRLSNISGGVEGRKMFICNFHPDHKKCLFDGTRIASYCSTGKREDLQCEDFKTIKQLLCWLVFFNLLVAAA